MNRFGIRLKKILNFIRTNVGGYFFQQNFIEFTGEIWYNDFVTKKRIHPDRGERDGPGEGRYVLEGAHHDLGNGHEGYRKAYGKKNGKDNRRAVGKGI